MVVVPVLVVVVCSLRGGKVARRGVVVVVLVEKEEDKEEVVEVTEEFWDLRLWLLTRSPFGEVGLFWLWLFVLVCFFVGIESVWRWGGPAFRLPGCLGVGVASGRALVAVVVGVVEEADLLALICPGCERTDGLVVSESPFCQFSAELSLLVNT